MAKPLTAQQQLNAIRAEGCRVAEYTGWRDRGMSRAASKGWAPQGVVIHHTAGGLGARTAQQYIRDILVSDRAVPDKCNVAIAPDGTVWMVAAGRANHMLYYSQRARDMAVAGTWPTSGSTNARGSLQNGNSWTYGVECIAAGVPNAAQRDAAVRWAAALCRAHGWSGGEVFGHGEAAYDRGFSDPGWDMGAFRRDVMARLKATNPATTRSVPQPAPQPAQEDPVPEHRETRTTLTHRGEGWQLPDGKATVATPRTKPMRIAASARVTAPIGVTVKTRWVSWSGREWVRYAVTEHATHEVETSAIVGQSAPGADLRLDVWADKPCAVGVEQSALIWEV